MAKFWKQSLLAGGLVIPITLATLTDWRLFTRAATYPARPIMAVDWYEPLQTIPGNPAKPFPQRSVTETPLDPAALAQVRDYAQQRDSTGLIVMHQGHVVLEDYWQGYGPDSPFNSMSMAKTLLGLLMGIAIAEGHIESLETPAAQYLPEWQNDDRASITLKDLLHMQSGLRNDDRSDTVASDLVQMYLGSDARTTALAIPSLRPPGEIYEYNNANTQILSLVIERATGEPYADYLSSRLWEPLGAADATIWLDRPGGNPKPFCCVFATARDWARVGQLILDGGRVGDRQVVPAAWIEAMLTPSPLEPTFGYHIWVKARTPDYPNVDQAATVPFVAPTFYLDGKGLQRVYIIPSLDLIVVRMGEDPLQWDDSVIPNTLLGQFPRAPE